MTKDEEIAALKAKLAVASNALSEISQCQEGFGDHANCEESLCQETHELLNRALNAIKEVK